MYRALPVEETGHGNSDRELLAGVIERDETALGTLYDRYSGLVFSIALRITGDHAVAEEVLQDTFFAVWRTAASFQQGHSFAAWLIGIARHRAIDATRSGLFRARGREALLEPAEAYVAADGPDVQLEQQLTADQVRAAVRLLPPAQALAVELAYYGGLSQAEIASRLGAPLGTIKTRLRLGLQHMRRALTETPTHPTGWVTTP